jgi:hypothetical protein
VIFIGGVFVITILETHRTVGAVYAIRRRLVEAREGDLHSPLRLRQGDTLTDLVEPFNDLMSDLGERARAEADELDRLADEAGEASTLSAPLRELAQHKRDLAA